MTCIGVNLLIDGQVRGTAFNEVLAIRDTEVGNQTIKFYAYSIEPDCSKIKLFDPYFTDGLITADGLVVGPPIGRGGYQRTCNVPEYKRGIGVGLLSPSVEFKDEEMKMIEELFGKEVAPKGIVLPLHSVVEFELKRGHGFVYADHDLVTNISPNDLSKFQVKKSKEKVRFIKF